MNLKEEGNDKNSFEWKEVKTKFGKEKMNTLCGLLKVHGTDCATLVEILKVAYDAYPDNAMNTYKHVRLLKEFGIIGDRDMLCCMCVNDVIKHHADNCEEYKKNLKSEYVISCPEECYNYSKCESAVWMVDAQKVYRLERKAALEEWYKGNKDKISSWTEERDGKEFITRGFNHIGRTEWLQKMFPDIDSDIRFNLWRGFLCDRHIGSMKAYANKITGYK